MPVDPTAGRGDAATVGSVFRYRTLQGKCDLGIGLDWDEIEELSAIEHAFAPTALDARTSAGRRFRREAVELTALVRGDRIHDRVAISELAPGGLVLRHAPFIARAEAVEIILDTPASSYRFTAAGIWIRDDADDYAVGLVFRGMPVCVRRTVVSPHEADVVDSIAA